MWEDTSNLGARYYHEGNRALSNMPGGSVTPMLIAGAVGYLIGWMVHGQSRNHRSIRYDRHYDGHYRNLPEYYG
jgi:hypothetical protein